MKQRLWSDLGGAAAAAATKGVPILRPPLLTVSPLRLVDSAQRSSGRPTTLDPQGLGSEGVATAWPESVGPAGQLNSERPTWDGACQGPPTY